MMNQFLKILQPTTFTKEFRYDKLLICKQTYQNETYQQEFFHETQQFGIEIGQHYLHEKNGDYHKIFHHLYLEEDLLKMICGKPP